jgi:hypothetical protein
MTPSYDVLVLLVTYVERFLGGWSLVEREGVVQMDGRLCETKKWLVCHQVHQSLPTLTPFTLTLSRLCYLGIVVVRMLVGCHRGRSRRRLNATMFHRVAMEDGR